MCFFQTQHFILIDVVNKIQIPGMDGMLDISESLSNEVVYSNRTLSVKFLLEEQDEESQQRRMNEEETTEM